MDYYSTVQGYGAPVDHEFINMNSFGKIHQDLQSTRISQDLNDVQAIVNFLKETMTDPVKEKSRSLLLVYPVEYRQLIK